jgi:hypothetical protein
MVSSEMSSDARRGFLKHSSTWPQNIDAENTLRSHLTWQEEDG